jgi:chemotaxis protein MotA
MWGIFMANLFWLPIGDKLRALHNEEMQILQVMLSGVYAVQLGETPSVIRSRLISAFPLSQQPDLLKNKIKLFTEVRKGSEAAPIQF